MLSTIIIIKYQTFYSSFMETTPVQRFVAHLLNYRLDLGMGSGLIRTFSSGQARWIVFAEETYKTQYQATEDEDFVDLAQPLKDANGYFLSDRQYSLGEVADGNPETIHVIEEGKPEVETLGIGDASETALELVGLNDAFAYDTSKEWYRVPDDDEEVIRVRRGLVATEIQDLDHAIERCLRERYAPRTLSQPNHS